MTIIFSWIIMVIKIIFMMMMKEPNQALMKSHHDLMRSQRVKKTNVSIAGQSVAASRPPRITSN